MKFTAFTLTMFSLLFFKLNDMDAQSTVVLELFTSQGCSSCPPADKLLDDLQSDASHNVIVLSYHVDYWNYIGWNDPFSKKEYTDRQRAYASRFKSSSIYTPQLVINGQEHFVGSNRSAIKSAIRSYEKTSIDAHLELRSVKSSGSQVNFEYSLEGSLKGKSLRAILVIENRTTVVKKGENRNRTLVNSHIVVNEETLNNPQAKEGSIEIPKIVNDQDQLKLILVLESSQKIVAGAEIAL